MSAPSASNAPVGPITVDPSVQGAGVGRRLMEAVIECGQGAAGVRLVQDAFKTRSYSLYASLGFEVKEPLLLMRGTPRGEPSSSANVRLMTYDDVTACERLCTAVHGYERSHELRDALRLFIPFVVERDGRISGYLTAATFWLMNHGVAETEQDMQALILGAGTMNSEPLSFLLPTRQAIFFRWCLQPRAEGGQADDADGHGQLPRAAADIETWRLLAAMGGFGHPPPAEAITL